MPAIAAATLSKIVVLIGIEAEDVDDGVDDHHVAGADQRPELALTGSERRHDDLRDADRQGQHRAGAEHRAFGAAEGDHAVELALAIEVEREPLQAGEHAVDGFAAAAGVAERIERAAAEAGDFGARHVGYEVERTAQDARVGHDGAEAERMQAIPDVRDLGALGVKCADEQNRLHISQRPGRRAVACRAPYHTSAVPEECEMMAM